MRRRKPTLERAKEIAAAKSAQQEAQMPRPNQDRIRISFHVSQAGLAAIDERAAAVKWTRAEMLRHMLAYAHQHMPTHKAPRSK